MRFACAGVLSLMQFWIKVLLYSHGLDLFSFGYFIVVFVSSCYLFWLSDFRVLSCFTLTSLTTVV